MTTSFCTILSPPNFRPYSSSSTHAGHFGGHTKAQSYFSPPYPSKGSSYGELQLWPYYGQFVGKGITRHFNGKEASIRVIQSASIPPPFFRLFNKVPTCSPVHTSLPIRRELLTTSPGP
ncbi:hypothetical protein AMTRI_Chr11g99180 [Amborella trichopoda]